MSSILEALERAEEERGRGAKRALGIAPPVAIGPRFSTPLILSLVALLVVVISVVMWLSVERATPPADLATPPQPAPVPRQTPVAAEPTAVAMAPAPSVVKPTLSVPDQLRRNTLPSAKPLMDEAVVEKPPARPLAPPPASRPSTPLMAPESPVVTERPVEETLQTPPVESSARPAGRVMEMPVSEPAVVEERARPVSETDLPAPPAEPEIPLVWELPQLEREKVLSLKSSVHVYNKDPAQRFVIINMHRYGEGDTLPPDGFRLERIDQDGVVIDYGAGLVRLLRR